MNIQIGDLVQTTIGKSENRSGVNIKVDQIQLGIEEKETEIKGYSVLKRGGAGKEVLRMQIR